MKTILVLACMVLLTGNAYLAAQQHQLVLIKNDDVVIRYRQGDDIVYKRKRSKDRLHAFIVEINDSTIITSIDTFATHQIERIYFRKGNLLNEVGTFLVMGGVAIFAIDQVNTLAVRGEKASLDDNVTKISLTSLGVGLPLMLLAKNSHRVGFRQRLRIVKRDSPFYYSETRFKSKGYISPHLPRN